MQRANSHWFSTCSTDTETEYQNQSKSTDSHGVWALKQTNKASFKETEALETATYGRKDPNPFENF